MSNSSKSSRSLAGIAGLVAIATLVSKVAGLVRQQAIAAAFGVGPAVDAYTYAYVIPGFLLILLGGINGPFHSAIVSALAKRKPEEAAPLVETITTLISLILLPVTLFLMVAADPLIHLVAPGLLQTPEGLEIHAIAVEQLRIMAPLALLAGWIGIGFGTLNAGDRYFLPSISPLFSSLTILASLGALFLQLGSDIINPEYARIGGQFLAWGTLGGAAIQWFAQLVVQWRSGLGTLRLRFQFRQPGVGQVLRVLGPATLSSGMMQINVYTDLFFASFIPQTASALGYAGLLVQTPLGILSNMLLVPLLPVFSRLTEPENWPELKQRIRQGMILTALTMLPLGGLMIALSDAIVRVVYERGAFNPQASQFVSSLLVAYGIGMFVYLGRDVLVRVFYALGDGQTPFRISTISIVLNGVLDYVLIQSFGAPGLVLATVGVNLFSMVAMIILLDRKLQGLRWQGWIVPILSLTVVSAIASSLAWFINNTLEQLWTTPSFLFHLLQLSISGSIGLGIFALLCLPLKLPETEAFIARIRQKLGR
ncbi:MAG: murein biosynthesis integral membrane protein MurJ [Roseofilum sp. SBFL]|uniref:murein biosynthesis integral membrane protein MurJ n=1 Tax=unclassified Roseofilum TaxID=2620099 RepID=UPI001B24ED64|nr:MULTISPECIES: murein biosynthesis integral membrane protein MurJ [unclassified Roseofilum]MBP0012690.1 murein biosynthesis integral membrane protein MurJ [Roseofilum sp. SID3]MBP0026343.1 murein biosynthesis integral membrane protein MurJ [Roseofilum sp. SID2]MBP0040000.1 murein biosynthesis integral membrane protein MurJ [Roseofilum sp. SID1]MBP0042345.1 murein biosynthesis integral membrane protein MurJ [Roseofilum sp. SBFL]